MTRINYTGRQRILRESVGLRVNTDPTPKLYVDRLDLSEVELPPDARIILEAQRRTNFMRLESGTVAAPDLPAGVPLVEFDSPNGMTFRVKVVGVSGDDLGKLLAGADGLRAVADGEPVDRTALLSVRPADLGQSLWRLDIDEAGNPSLLINKSIAMGWNEFARLPLFRALVFPEVTRQVAMWVVSNWSDADEDPESPVNPWIRYFRYELGQTLSESSIPAAEEDRSEWARDWADEVTAKFSRKHKFLESVNIALGDQ